MRSPAIRTQPASSGLVLRRKCACGTHTPGGDRCQSCRKEKIQRKAMGQSQPNSVPASVHGVLSSAGAPLAASDRYPMERGFGRDFSQVRVHTDAQAVRSAADVDALAYTVGSHVVFGAGQFAPASAAGRHLLAHELAHVVQQQGAVLQRKAQSGWTMGDANDAAEKEADAAADAIVQGGMVNSLAGTPPSLRRAPRPGAHLPHRIHHAPAIEGLDPDGPGADLTGTKETALWQCLKGTAGIPDACPHAPLTWADFTATNAISFPAQVVPLIRPMVMDPKVAGCVEGILGWSEGQTHVYQAIFGGGQARKSTLGMLDDSINGCGKLWSGCQAYFSRGTPVEPFTIHAAGRRCAASFTAVGLKATSFDECDQLQADCHARAELEQARLLRHEQGHMDIACALARKVNALIADGAPPCAFENSAQQVLNRLTIAYDGQTDHGCIAGKQAAWEANVRAGLPNVTVPKQACRTPRPPRRGRPRPTAPPRGPSPPHHTGMRL